MWSYIYRPPKPFLKTAPHRPQEPTLPFHSFPPKPPNSTTKVPFWSLRPKLSGNTSHLVIGVILPENERSIQNWSPLSRDPNLSHCVLQCQTRPLDISMWSIVLCPLVYELNSTFGFRWAQPINHIEFLTPFCCVWCSRACFIKIWCFAGWELFNPMW